ncbi:MAG: WG repeat-containing protein [Bacteroidia bacterium]
MKRFSVIILLLCHAEMRPSQIDKAFEALRIYDYFKAKQIFYKQLKKHPAEAGYGLATIYFRNDNPFHQLDSSYKYIIICRNSKEVLSPEKKLLAEKKYNITDTAISILHDSVCYKAYMKFMRNPTIESSEKYLQVYFQSPFNKKVFCLRDSFAFTQLKTKMSSEACQNYMLTYPQSCYLDETRSMNEFSLYIETTGTRTDKGYETYLSKFPTGKYIQLAKEELLNFYVKQKDAKNIYSFIKKYGSSYPTTYAWNMLLGIEVPDYTKNELENFLNKYPDYPQKADIEEEFKYWQVPFLSIKKNDLLGFCDSTGKTVIEPQYTEAEDFSEGYALVQKNDLYGYINKPGKIKIDFQFTEASSFINHVAIVQKDKMYYLIDYSNKVLSARYDEIADFSEGMAIVKKNNLYGAINLNGEEIVKPAFENLGDYSEGLAAFNKNGQYGFIDKQGFTFISPMYNWVSPFKNGACRVQYNKFYGLINKKGDFIIKPEYDILDEASKGIYLLVKNNLYGFADSTGCLLSEIKYNYNPALKPAELAGNNFMRLITAKKQDLQSANGNKLFADQNYDEVFLPVNNLVLIKEKNKYSIYNLAKVAFAKKNLASVYTDGTYWYLRNKKGLNVYAPDLSGALFAYDAEKISSFEKNYFLVEGEDGKGLLGINGNEILSPVYDEIKAGIVPDIFYVVRNEKGAYYSVSARNFIWKEDGF